MSDTISAHEYIYHGTLTAGEVSAIHKRGNIIRESALCTQSGLIYDLGSSIASNNTAAKQTPVVQGTIRQLPARRIIEPYNQPAETVEGEVMENFSMLRQARHDRDAAYDYIQEAV